MVSKVADIRRASAEKKLAVNFHFQGSNALLGDLNLVEAYRRLGVGHMILAYNMRNLAGDGCHEDTDAGLSAFGKALVGEMNRFNMIIDVSHTSLKTSMEAIECSSQPVIMSHSNARGVFAHERNITDEQAKACAESGGVIGVNGVGLFLSEARHDASADIIARHADYFANLVGMDHVGIGMDSVDDIPYFLQNFGSNNRAKYPKGGYLTSSALAYFVAPVIFFLNLYYCLTVIRKDGQTFYPSKFATWFGWLSLVVFTGMSVILILQRLFGIALFTA